MKEILSTMSKPHKVLLLTDLHLRSNYLPGFLDTQVKTLSRLANDSQSDSIVIGGDIFEKRNPEGEEMLAFDRLLDLFVCKDVYVLRGNHDTLRKDGSTSSVLSLYENKATIITRAETFCIGGVDFDFIPHYEDEKYLIKLLNKSNNPLFGHFGFDGCVSNGFYEYESKVKLDHFKDKLTFLGHIHKPMIYGNVRVMGTQYSNTFGEANAQKFLTLLEIRDGDIEITYNPITYGIRHVVGTYDEISDLNDRHSFGDFFTILRVKVDKLDEHTQEEITDNILKKYSVSHLEIAFEDILPKFDSNYEPDEKVFSLDESLISDYIDASDTIFSKKELLESLKEIKDEN